MVLLTLIGFALIVFGLFAFAKALYYIFKAGWVLIFANEKQVDDQYRNSFKNSQEYKNHSKQVDNIINS